MLTMGWGWVYNDVIKLRKAQQGCEQWKIMDNVLGRTNKSIMQHATSIISCPEFYTLDEIYQTYVNIMEDLRLSVNTRNELLKSLKKIYRERSNLSFGQKAVGILLILLYGTTISDNNQLLILDQPEDDLDNAYVYHTLVKELDKVKEKRQLIVATHSPNIAVAGNSENIIVLKGNGENSWIECNGTIYNKAVSAEAINILEGNEIAFKERAELYGIII